MFDEIGDDSVASWKHRKNAITEGKTAYNVWPLSSVSRCAVFKAYCFPKCAAVRFRLGSLDPGGPIRDESETKRWLILMYLGNTSTASCLDE